MCRCCNCGGLIVYGEPHVMNGKPRTYWCIDCIEEYSDMCWPEDWGPRNSPTPINRSHLPGHA